MLPKLSVPTFEVELPSTGKTIKLRRYLVKEQVALLMAKEGNAAEEILNAIKDTVSACLITEGINIDTLPVFDIEYLFLQLRAKSVEENIRVVYTCNNVNEETKKKCDGEYSHTIDINQLTVVNKKPSKKIKIDLTNEAGLEMKYPSFSILNKYATFFSGENEDRTKTPLDIIFNLLYDCVKCVYTKDEVYESFSFDEFKDFVSDLTDDQFKKVMTFFETMPKLNYEFDFSCNKCGNKEHMKLSSLVDFFELL